MHSSPTTDQRTARRPLGREWIALVCGFIIAAGVTAYGARIHGVNGAINELRTQGRTAANLKVALLRAVLERPRALPVVLSQDRDITDALATSSTAAIDSLNRKLEGLVKDTQAAVIYVIATDGIAISSSNWQEPLSFVGNNYAFRDYFRTAMRSGSAEHFALGSVSKRPGLYISRRIGTAAKPLGVVVVKMEFDQLEDDWRDAGPPTYIVDARGVVLITSIPDWRFMTIRPLLDSQMAAIRASLQFGDAPLRPLPIIEQTVTMPDTVTLRAEIPGYRQREFLKLATRVPGTSWSLQYLMPLKAMENQSVRQSLLVAFSVLIPLFVVMAIIVWRRQAAALRLAREAETRIDLERRVLARTEDLSRARDLLEAEIGQRHSAEERLQGVQQELVAANRLAILGQVAAGVAHEINQPVATIRAYADNARTFLERGQTVQVVENLNSIADLTERIGTITEELKAFARKGRASPEPIVLHDAIEGAVLLLRSRFAGKMEALDIQLPPEDLTVLGNRIRLEQVFINLFQNALEALAGCAAGRIEVRVTRMPGVVSVTIADNGPGIPADILEALFTPFNTSKERGLGLGLVITKEILADYGGTINAACSPQGTRFTLILKAAA